ncbi:hypothetical protein EDC18_103252 [Natranaerovirga pectinivora]|uniref:AP2/ERF domain-containing protein n=1 Tax=Natranaerovirga pectinivora TaxID=682400 RepID=A0A4R3MLH1_9FIRM|nr:hypothetical protein [Natranaerovirga pectinivora]TCT15546.1 hypothetical protein EDC18_103252 [Natranaerovirga pectinivora]
MSLLLGVYKSALKSGKPSYRSSITYNNKHISIGSFSTELEAHTAYLEAKDILLHHKYTLNDYLPSFTISFHKWVVLLNFRDNKYYIKNPIYLYKYYFSYFLDENTELIFDVDDLFYYSNHKIFRRQGYLFVNDYGMQVNILSRYGIKNYAVENRDYLFKDGDRSNLRYHNIEVINPYYGVSKDLVKGKTVYTTKIHINGDYIVGRYPSIEEAAIAYNKAIDYLVQIKNINKKFNKNYLEDMNKDTYSELYKKVSISNKIKTLQL